MRSRPCSMATLWCLALLLTMNTRSIDSYGSALLPSSFSRNKRSFWETKVHPFNGSYKRYPVRFPSLFKEKFLTSTRLSTSSSTDAETVNGPQQSESVISSTTSTEKAILALEKLAQRQKEELQETMVLLNRLNGDSQTDSSSISDDDENDTHSLRMTAVTLLRGVDYGFQSRSEGATIEKKGVSGLSMRQSYGPPANIVTLGTQQFFRNLNAIKGEYSANERNDEITVQQKELQQQLKMLTLNTTAIWEREEKYGKVKAPWIIQIPYYVLCLLLDTLFEGKYVFNRFFLLETVARMPYFSYITMLHFYETLGFWRRSADVKRIHFAEELNEYRHLLIQESLGGDQQWSVRFLAQHSALAYFVVLCLLWAISPTLSYKFSEMLETHAVHTYGQFLDENEEKLKQLPPSYAAVEYYTFGASDPFYAEFQVSALSEGKDIRRPGSNMQSLYDVFQAIRADEADHVSAMKACLDPDTVLRSLSIEKQFLLGLALATVASTVISSGGMLDSMTTNVAIDDAALGILESIVAGGAALVSEIFGKVGGVEEVESIEIGTLLREFDLIGAVGIFLVGVRKFIVDIFQMTIRLIESFLFPRK